MFTWLSTEGNDIKTTVLEAGGYVNACTSLPHNVLINQYNGVMDIVCMCIRYCFYALLGEGYFLWSTKTKDIVTLFTPVNSWRFAKKGFNQKGCIHIELQTWGVDSWVSSQLSISSRNTESVKSQKYKVLWRAYFLCSNSKKKIRLHKTLLLRSKNDIYLFFNYTLRILRPHGSAAGLWNSIYIHPFWF